MPINILDHKYYPSVIFEKINDSLITVTNALNK